MCRRVDCSKCSKPTWAGCGMHIESALAGVPQADRCACPRDSACVITATAEQPKTQNNQQAMYADSYAKLIAGLQ